MEFQSKNIALQRGSTTTAINNYSSGGSGLVSAPLNYLQLTQQTSNLITNGIIQLPTSIGGLLGSVTGETANYFINSNGWIFSNGTKNIAGLDKDGKLNIGSLELVSDSKNIKLDINADGNLLLSGSEMTNKPVIQSIVDGVYQDLLINPNGGNVSINTEDSEGYRLNVNGTLKTKDITINGGTHNNVLSTNSIDGSFTLNGQPLGARIYKIDELLTGTFSSEDISNSVNAYVGKNLLQRVTAIETTGSQPAFNGIGFVKANGSTISYDSTSYLPTRTFGTAANNNTSDFYATGSTVVNSTDWLGWHNALDGGPYDGSPTSLLGYYNDGSKNIQRFTPTAIKSWLGLGSSAYTDTNDHILNQNSSTQTANMWINGVARANSHFRTGVNATMFLGVGGDISGAFSSTDFILYNTGGDAYLLGTGGNGLKITASTGAAIFASTIQTKGLVAYRVDGGAGLIVNGGDLGSASTIATFNDYSNNPKVYIDGRGVLASNVTTGTAPLTVNSTTMVSNLNTENLGVIDVRGSDRLPTYYKEQRISAHFNNGYTSPTSYEAGITITGRLGLSAWQLVSGVESDNTTRDLYFRAGTTTWGSTYKIYHSGNLTNTLSTNYIPKWNGSSFVNSLISDADGYINATNGSSGTYYSAKNNVGGYINIGITSNTTSEGYINFTSTLRLNGAPVVITSTTQSTSPTTGALVVNGGAAINNQLSFGIGGGHYGNPGAFNTASSGDKLILYNNGTDYDGRIGVGSSGNLWIKSTGNTGGGLFEIYTGSGSLSMTVLGNGNTNIGYITDQGYKLAVNGNTLINGNINLNSNTNIRTIWGGVNGGCVQILSDSSTVNRWARIGVCDSVGNFNAGLVITNDGNSNFSGNVTASNFIGNGSQLTQITKLWAESHPTSYYLKNNWDGQYWQLTSNHPSAVSVGHSDQSTNSDTVDGVHMWRGSLSAYNALSKDANTMYIII